MNRTWPGIVVAAAATVALLFPSACTPSASKQPNVRPSIPSSGATSQPLSAGAAFSAPFDGKTLPLVSLAEGLSQMQRQVSLPDSLTVGVPTAIAVNHGPGRTNALWLYYPPGVFFEIEPNRDGISPAAFLERALSNGRRLAHPNGEPYLRRQTVRGRETLVATPGEVLQDGKRTHMGSAAPALNWVENGYVYVVRPMPLGFTGGLVKGAPGLDALLRFANATP